MWSIGTHTEWPHHKQYEKIKERRKKPDHCRSNMKTRNQKKLWKEALLARIEFWSSWSWQVSHRSIWLSLIYEGGEKEHEVIIQLLCCQNEGWGPLTRRLWHASKFTKQNANFVVLLFRCPGSSIPTLRGGLSLTAI